MDRPIRPGLPDGFIDLGPINDIINGVIRGIAGFEDIMGICSVGIAKPQGPEEDEDVAPHGSNTPWWLEPALRGLRDLIK